ncbi:DNA topoisomerase 2 [Theileria orientalis strain Shintoku]|uniref:DNA topoisomerase 2 n=1 Tax=Theileria orientalis strain Shintoku TaxID=869250 RepID=J4DNV4_THEOR|nr:DNA topoisomerase 2 [Theileria orientalis strain Shintoku]BAM39614.1 DNA topoisomerase 2 [Theileria orientalis strain Shintoku]|eukprot:XP_009689915.1 DNA topoisomerase 2 [Theileria orientalis strain Shintoku]
MILRFRGSIWNNYKLTWLCTLVLLCNIIKVSSGYILNHNGIIRNSAINISNPCDSNIWQKCKNKYNNFYLKNASNDLTQTSSYITDDNEDKLSEKLPESSSSYSSDDIIILEGLNAVRKRPGMYIGNTGERGVHQLLYEVLDNSVDEYLAGFCNRICVSLLKDGSVEISDNGRGIPCDTSPKTGKSGLETVLTILHSGGKFQDILNDNLSSSVIDTPNKNGRENLKEHEKKIYEYSSGLHGVGLSVVNALSEFLFVDVYKGDKRYHIELSKGHITKPLAEYPLNQSEDKSLAPNKDTNAKNGINGKKYGTKIRFLPDYQNIFKTHHQHIKGNSDAGNQCLGCTNGFQLELIKTRVKELSYLNPGLFFELVDYRIKGDNGYFKETYHNNGGTRAFLSELTKDNTPLYKPIQIITIKGNYLGVNLEVSFSWSMESYTAMIKAYANNVSTLAGTHIDGFKTSITRSVNGLLKKYGYFKGSIKPLNGEFIREGMTAVISVRLSGAEFDGQTKTKLGNAIVKTAVEKITNEQLTKILDENKELLIAIHNKSQAAKKAFDAAKTAKELVRQKSSSLISNISGKLTECSSNDIENNELFIVEGESAAGNAKQARNRQFQAVLPLKGKILNIEKITDNNKVLENQQIQLLLDTIGITVNPITWREKPSVISAPVHSNSLLGMKRLRYGKIILLTDADVDGSHLKSLLLCLLYRLCPSLYLEGRVYVAAPPLYRITNLKNKKYIYSWSPEHLLQVIDQLNANSDPDGFDDKSPKEVELKDELRSTDVVQIDAVNPNFEGSLNPNAGDSDHDFNRRLSRRNKRYVIQRFKGLGEMMARQLWETTMDPKTRILKRIVVSHQYEISAIIKMLMGSDVESRKQYIFNNADAFQLHDLDI